MSSRGSCDGLARWTWVQFPLVPICVVGCGRKGIRPKLLPCALPWYLGTVKGTSEPLNKSVNDVEFGRYFGPRSVQSCFVFWDCQLDARVSSGRAFRAVVGVVCSVSYCGRGYRWPLRVTTPGIYTSMYIYLQRQSQFTPHSCLTPHSKRTAPHSHA